MYSGYGRVTREIMRSIALGGYPSAENIRVLFDESGFLIPTFAENLWETMSAVYPCGMQRRMVSAYCASDERQAAKFLPQEKRGLWLRYCEEEQPQTDEEKAAAVRAFLGMVCVSHPMCRPCASKKPVIDFYASFEKGYDSAKRLVNSWLSGTMIPNRRESYIRLCYALSLRIYPTDHKLSSDERAEDVSRFLCFMCGQNPLHISNPVEAVHWFCLKNPDGLSGTENYERALSLIENLPEGKMNVLETGVFTMQTGERLEGVDTTEKLMELIASGELSMNDSYYTAQRQFRRFCEDYEIVVADSLMNGSAAAKNLPTKEKALRLLRTVDAFAKGASVDTAELAQLLSQYSLSDALYVSAMPKDAAEGRVQADRTLLLLTLLSMNYGIKYDTALSDISETDELTEHRNFGDFCRTLSAILKSCSMAPLYPRRRLDFLVLYSYYLMSRKSNPKGVSESLSWYFAKAVRAAMDK